MDERELKAVRDAATAYAREHARELATELLEWSDTALLRDGRVRELAQMLQVLDAAHALTLARSFAERAALELAARRTTPDREAIIEECAEIAERTYAKDAFRFELGTEAARAIRAIKAASAPSLRDTLIEEIAEMVDHMGEGRRLDEYVGAILEMKTAPTGDQGEKS
jgi:hypothetical protein